MDEIRFILECTLENAFVILPLALISGGMAFFAGRMATDRMQRWILLPLAAAELALFLTMVPYLARWVNIQSLIWGFWYEGGLNFYLPFSAMFGVLAGYLLRIGKKG
ncbi:hypothetical protein D1646_09500 [Pseudoflavonifractor sp. 60]|uniref:hypothetical protein n=1 Tax=Pseudoflavonifractor sp. 60 TaxID=2304576 RepID=UPI00136908F2|nr:hypothetical protein [Pseudoflavonifractor sp. 60]NBI67048.1 hypothetical protein [Pseudoflavonifractor sp. 60]